MIYTTGGLGGVDPRLAGGMGRGKLSRDAQSGFTEISGKSTYDSSRCGQQRRGR